MGVATSMIAHLGLKCIAAPGTEILLGWLDRTITNAVQHELQDWPQCGTCDQPTNITRRFPKRLTNQCIHMGLSCKTWRDPGIKLVRLARRLYMIGSSFLNPSPVSVTAQAEAKEKAEAARKSLAEMMLESQGGNGGGEGCS